MGFNRRDSIPGEFTIASLDSSQSRVRGVRGLRFSSLSFCRVTLLTVHHRRATMLQRHALIDFARSTLHTWYTRHPLSCQRTRWLSHKTLATRLSLYLSTVTTICALHSHSMYRGASQVADKTSFLDSPPEIRSALLSSLSLLTIGSNPGFLGSTQSLTPEVVNQHTRLCIPFELITNILGRVAGLVFADTCGSDSVRPCLIYCRAPLQMAFWRTKDITGSLLLFFCVTKRLLSLKPHLQYVGPRKSHPSLAEYW